MKNKVLARQILEMAKLDQQVRKAYGKNPSLANKMKVVDRTNLVKMKKIIRKFGWPTIKLVGKKTSNLAWLLIQHSNHDLKFQKYCLRLMIKEAEKGNVLWENVAYLTDRILVNDGNPQLYGTQFYESKGKLIPRLIKNIDNLNERRKKMGLESFEIYKNKLLKQYRR